MENGTNNVSFVPSSYIQPAKISIPTKAKRHKPSWIRGPKASNEERISLVQGTKRAQERMKLILNR